MSDSDVNMLTEYENLASHIKDKFQYENKQVLIAVAGSPGSGKSTLTSRLQKLLDSCIVVPMDGYHYSKAELSVFPDPEQAFKRRGAEWTFNSNRFLSDIQMLYTKHEGSFPSFDHAIGDPIENDIIVKPNHKYVLIEGNYILLETHPWIELKQLFDFSVFIDADHETLRHRVIRRHVSVGQSVEEATTRYETNDFLNAIEIEKSKKRADMVIMSK